MRRFAEKTRKNILALPFHSHASLTELVTKYRFDTDQYNNYSNRKAKKYNFK